MKKLAKQDGMSMWGVIGLILIGLFFMLLLFKLMPPYMDDIKVGSAIKRVAKKPGAGSKSANELLISIEKMFGIENISHISAAKDIEIVPQGDTAKIIKLEYEREVPMTGNISVVIFFDHSVEAR